MSLRCFFGLHDPGGLVGRGLVLSVRCNRCHWLSPGVVIDGPPPQPMAEPVAKPRSRIWWVKGVYVRQA